MDFISLATEFHPSRLLDEILGDDEPRGSPGGDATTGNVYDTSTYDYSTGADSASVQRPLFSKTAEAELYLLATNFLLYVALVIVSIIVAKIYFPESLERGTGSAATPRTRSYSYRMAAKSQDDEDASYYGSDVEEDVLDSDEDSEERLLRKEQQVQHNPMEQTRSTNLFEFQQSSLSRLQVIRRLVFCSLMLNLTFVLWGVLQERMLTRRYPRFTGEYFTYSYALVFTNRFWTLIMSGLLLIYLRPRFSTTTIVYEYSFPSISNMLSSWCQYEALRYVSFPATTLFKSFKLAPVMLMGKILGNKTYPAYDYLVALLIGIGIAMFMTSTDDLSIGNDYSSTWTGVMLLCLYLFFDSFTSQFQSRMFQRHRDLSMVELMFATSAYSTVLSFVTLLHTKELYPALKFVTTHSEIHLHFFLFSICSSAGQLLIYYSIKNFGAVVFTLIMTCRILLSIALSCVLYGHEVSASGFFGLMLVMAAVIYRIRRKAQGSKLIKWQGMDDEDKAFELVQEWHEHVDM